ncbi:transposase [Dysosmobacter sp.]|uniref:transposase n=1 Tax=Dysosmobacter sp. TaxID=2591382 RepID=UPI003AF010D1
MQRHIWKDYEELADDARYTPVYAQLYKCRKETIERVFADAKEKHAMRYTQYRGLAQVTNWVKLKFAAMNLKKIGHMEMEESVVLVSLCCFFAHICSRPSLLLSTDRVPRQTVAGDWHTVSRFNYTENLGCCGEKQNIRLW